MISNAGHDFSRVSISTLRSSSLPSRSCCRSFSRTREKLRQQLREGKLDERRVEIETREKSCPAFEIISNQGEDERDINVKDILPYICGQRRRNANEKEREA